MNISKKQKGFHVSTNQRVKELKKIINITNGRRRENKKAI